MTKDNSDGANRGSFLSACFLGTRMFRACFAVAQWLLLLAFPAVLHAQYTYTTNDGEITITRYLGTESFLTIPDSTNGYPVTTIGDDAFYGCWTLTNITVPNSVTSFGHSAFADCIYLTNITIPNTVTSIGSYAFGDCAYLSSIAIPDSVTNIGDLLFENCFHLASVTMGNGITLISNNTFYSCTNLSSLTLGTGLTTIQEGAFVYCFSLTNIYIPAALTNLGSYHLIAPPNLLAMTVDPANPVYTSVDGVLFNKSTNILMKFPEGRSGSYAVPNTVTNIRMYAFESSQSLTSVTIPDSVLTISNEAFFNCGNLARVDLPNTLSNLASGLFWSCTNLGSITIPNTVTNISGEAFYSCTNLTNLTIPASVRSIGIDAFEYCNRLTGLYFETNAPTANSVLFTGATNVTVYYLPNTTGWTNPWKGRPAVLWNPQVLTSDASFGLNAGQFGFPIIGNSNLTVVVEACNDLSNPTWLKLTTNTLDNFIGTNGTSYFTDPDSLNYSTRYYRLRWP